MTDLTSGMRGTGVEVQVTQQRLAAASDRFDETVRVAQLAGDHVWLVLVTHHVADPGAFMRENEGHLDAESIIGCHIGCYICEEPYNARLATRRCKGEPR